MKIVTAFTWRTSVAAVAVLAGALSACSQENSPLLEFPETTTLLQAHPLHYPALVSASTLDATLVAVVPVMSELRLTAATRGMFDRKAEKDALPFFVEGSGVLIDTPHGPIVLTAAHVVVPEALSKGSPQDALLFDGKTYNAEDFGRAELRVNAGFAGIGANEVLLHPSLDLALLRFDPTLRGGLQARLGRRLDRNAESTEAIGLGSEVAVLSFPGSAFVQESRAIVSDVRPPRHLVLGKAMKPGSSGGLICGLDGKPQAIVLRAGADQTVGLNWNVAWEMALAALTGTAPEGEWIRVSQVPANVKLGHLSEIRMRRAGAAKSTE